MALDDIIVCFWCMLQTAKDRFMWVIVLSGPLGQAISRNTGLSRERRWELQVAYLVCSKSRTVLLVRLGLFNEPMVRTWALPRVRRGIETIPYRESVVGARETISS